VHKNDSADPKSPKRGCETKRVLLPLRKWADFGAERKIWAFFKPAGISSHAVSLDRPGFAEFVSAVFEDPSLTLAHRLDKATQGLLVFSGDSPTAENLRTLFANRQVDKSYIFVTRARAPARSFVIRSHIAKVAGEFTNVETEPENSETLLDWIRSDGEFYLWQARPQTGKPHQIRLHTLKAGIPILGDRAHGGEDFPLLMLMAEKISFPCASRPQYGPLGETVESTISARAAFELPRPAYYEALTELRDPTWLTYEKGVARREALFSFNEHPHECLRLLHSESRHLRLDRFGSQLWFYHYSDEEPTADDRKLYHRLLSRAGAESAWIRQMKNRGQESQMTLEALGPALPRWIAEENGVRFELRSDCGLSPGLFLDQRENRLWVRENSRGRRVLNLFAYTAGFSVNAALGGAASVCTVDASRVFTEWGKTNFALNGLPTDSPHEFWAADVFYYLAGAQRKKRTFDLIICDPPSFGRTQNGPFSLERDLKRLMQEIRPLLAPRGRLLLTLNFEKWDHEKLAFEIRAAWGNSCRLTALPAWGWDYELPGEPPLMKGFVVELR
jgi:23S rRNA (cytosine1962-C5)-methyltransferase